MPIPMSQQHQNPNNPSHTIHPKNLPHRTCILRHALRSSGIRHQSSAKSHAKPAQHIPLKKRDKLYCPSGCSCLTSLSCLLRSSFFLMAALLSAYAASLHCVPKKSGLHCDQQQRIQPLPVYWLACESATDRSDSHGFLMVFLAV